MTNPNPQPLPYAQPNSYSYPSFGHRPDAYAIQAFASKKAAAGICGILIGGLGVHKFILGFPVSGTVMLVVWLFGFITGSCLIIPLFACMAMGVIGLIEGILYLTKSDEEFYDTYAIQRKEWF